MKKKIWIVTELFYPDETAVAYIFTRIANHLSKQYKIGVICGPEFYDKNKIGFTDVVELSEEIEVFRTKSISLDKNSLFQRTLRLVILSIRMALMMLKRISRREIVILATNPAPLLLLIRLIKFFKRFQLHILVHDVFPENAIPAGIFSGKETLLYRMIKYSFDKSYACSDHLIVIGKDMSEIMQSKVNRFKNHPSVSIVTNWSNPERINVSNLKRENGAIVIQYAGNIGRVQGLIEIIEAFKQSNQKKLHLKICGTGALYEYLRNYIENNSLTNVSLSGAFSRREENKILSDCDIGIVSLSPGMYGLGVPSKSYNLLSAGKPILYFGDPKTEVSRMILENNIGWSVNIQDQNAIIECFKKVSSIDKKNLEEMGSRARFLAENDFKEENILKLFQTEIEKIQVDKK